MTIHKAKGELNDKTAKHDLRYSGPILGRMGGRSNLLEGSKVCINELAGAEVRISRGFAKNVQGAADSSSGRHFSRMVVISILWTQVFPVKSV